MSHKQDKRIVRRRRLRAKISGTAVRPRLSIYRSNNNIYAQLVDDDKGVTLVSAVDGKGLAKKALEKKISKIVFDRGGFIYTGRVKKFADDAREGGLIF